MFVRNEKILFMKDGSPNKKVLLSLLKEHDKEIKRWDKLEKYYDGEHTILTREKSQKDLSNNKVVVNHAEYISDFATAYFMGNPIKYKVPESENRTDDDELTKAFKSADINQVDTDNTHNLSIMGSCIEYVYQNRDGKTKSASLSPKEAFVVGDDTVEHYKLMGVHRVPNMDEDNKQDGERVIVITNTRNYFYTYKNGELKEYEPDDSKSIQNLFNRVNLIEYLNKPKGKGDYENVLTLIDMYNLLQSDRINDKEQFVDALLVLYGQLAGDTSEEKIETARLLKEMGLLELGAENRAEYLSKTFNESEIEVLRKSVVSDIHKISKVPDLTDENFAGNSSGVAMKYKLLGLEQLAQTKEGYYRKGIKERIVLYANILNIKKIAVEVDDIEITFTRSLPTNLLEISQTVMNFKGLVSDETLLKLLDFIEDVNAEMERIKEQKEESIKQMQSQFGGYNTPALGDNPDDNEVNVNEK